MDTDEDVLLPPPAPPATPVLPAAPPAAPPVLPAPAPVPVKRPARSPAHDKSARIQARVQQLLEAAEAAEAEEQEALAIAESTMLARKQQQQQQQLMLQQQQQQQQQARRQIGRTRRAVSPPAFRGPPVYDLDDGFEGSARSSQYRRRERCYDSCWSRSPSPYRRRCRRPCDYWPLSGITTVGCGGCPVAFGSYGAPVGLGGPCGLGVGPCVGPAPYLPVTQTPVAALGTVCSVNGGGCTTTVQPAVQTCTPYGCRTDAVGPPNLPSLPSWYA